MKVPLAAGEPLHPEKWNSVRMQLMFDCCKWDIQSEDHCVVSDFPLLLEEREWLSLAHLAENLTQEALAAEREIYSRPELHAELGLSGGIRRVLRNSSLDDFPTGTARVMRFDFHFTPQGWQISEVNADVPGGFIEGSSLNDLMACTCPHDSIPPNPATAYMDLISSLARKSEVVGLVHATAHYDDRQVMEYLARGIRPRGVQPVVVSPSHLKWASGVARIESAFASAQPGMLVRFFPAEWLPNLRPASAWRSWFCGGKTPMSNPGSAILIQSKRFPLIWEKLKTPLRTWRNLLPETKRPTEVPIDSSEWVFKPVFGRVGEDIAIRGVTEQRAYDEITKDVKRHPDKYVAQRRFDAVPIETPAGRRFGCIGVFTLDGRAVGAYGRIASKPLIDQDAQDVAILLRRGDGSH